MPYEILYTDYVNKLGIVVEDGTINHETSLKIPGRNATAYGTVIAENFLHLLENFASPTEPRTPVEGQLWYDSTPAEEELKIYNGVNWLTVNGVNKSVEKPAYRREGDLWIDKENLQLFMYTDAAGWILIGPQFHAGVVTGATPKVVDGIDDISYNILQIDVNAMPSMIISTKEFTPKIKIPGFITLKPGINLTSRTEPNQLPLKYYGIAEKAESLYINNQAIPAGNFLRTDQVSSTSFRINVQNESGVNIGRNAEMNLGIQDDIGYIRSNIAGAGIDIKVRNDSLFKTLIRADAGMRVGINTTNPDQESTLDVAGNLKVSIPVEDPLAGNLVVSSAKDSNNYDTGSIVTHGGLGIAKNVNIGEGLRVGFVGISYTGGEVITRRIVPDITSDDIIGGPADASTIGTENLKYGEVHAKKFFGDLTGTVTGSVSGRAGSAQKLSTASIFSFLGDVELEDEVTFIGQGGKVNFATRLSNGFISSKDAVEEIQSDDELLVNRIRTDIGVKKVTVQKLLSAVPVMPIGTVVPYAGVDAPPGWLICNGQRVLRADFIALFEVIGYAYQGGVSTTDGMFTLPDLRGRFPMGLQSMGGSSPTSTIISDSAADTLGAHGGRESREIQVEHLPDHKHDLMHNGQQFYAMTQKQFNVVDNEIDDYHFYVQTSGSLSGLGLKNTDGVKTDTSLGEPLSTVNPFLTLNFIIYAG